MRVLLVNGDDYAATAFADRFAGISVAYIIDNIDMYYAADEEEEEYWELNVFDFPTDIPEGFVKFVRTYIQDYDDSKDTQFYLETDKI